MKGYFARKPVDIDDLKEAKEFDHARDIEVIAEVTLKVKDFREFANDLFSERNFIKELAGKTRLYQETADCLLVRQEGKKQAIAVASEGYDYPRYAALVELKANGDAKDDVVR